MLVATDFDESSLRLRSYTSLSRYSYYHTLKTRKPLLEVAPTALATVFSEREQFTFAICWRPFVVCHLSSVTLVHPTQAVVIFGNFSTAFGTLAID